MDKLVLLLLSGLINIDEACNGSYSQWINRHSPSSLTSEDGDIENWTKDERSAFCGHGKVSKIVCMTIYNSTIRVHPRNNVQSGRPGWLMCNVDMGLICYNRLVDGGVCLDYQISFSCDCSHEEIKPPDVSKSGNNNTTNVSNIGTVTNQHLLTVYRSINTTSSTVTAKRNALLLAARLNGNRRTQIGNTTNLRNKNTTTSHLQMTTQSSITTVDPVSTPEQAIANVLSDIGANKHIKEIWAIVGGVGGFGVVTTIVTCLLKKKLLKYNLRPSEGEVYRKESQTSTMQAFVE